MSKENFKHQLKGIYAITDPNIMSDKLLIMAQQAIDAGISILQYRNKTADIQQQEKEATSLAKLCKAAGVLFLVNDNVELAIKVCADGVHLGQSDTDINTARKKLGSDKIIGITCNNQISFAEKAQNDGADYIAFGRFYPSSTKPNAPQASISLLTQAQETIHIPIVAIGGITTENAHILLSQKVDMLAIIQGIFGQKNIPHACREFVDIFNAHSTP